MSKLHLKENPTLVDLQQYVYDLAIERGFDKDTLAMRYMLFVEEVGELAKAARKQAGVKMASNAASQDLAGEAADVFLMLLSVCNALNIDLEQAFRAKEEKNKQRVWK